MAERTYGGARRISVNTRPKSGSKSQRPARRRNTPTRNAVVFSEPLKHHSTTNFPLFSNNLVAKKPPVPQATKLAQVSERNQQLVSHIPRTRACLRALKSPTPVEVPSSVSNSQVSLSSVSGEPYR